MNDKWYLSGPLAIGTTEPKRALHVEGNGIHSGGTLAGLSFHNCESPGFVDTPTAGERWVWYSSGATARLWSGNDKLTISKEGNVGIGTATPAGRLNISEITGTPHSPNTGSLVIDHENAGGASSIIFRSKVNRTSDYGFIQFQDAATVGGAGESCRLIIGTNNDADDHIALMPAGNVGIGTNEPKSKLHISGLDSANIKLLSSDPVADFSYDGGTDSVFWFVHQGGDTGTTNFRNRNRDLLIIRNDGSVGIPGWLDVNGKLNVAGALSVGQMIRSYGRDGKTVPLCTEYRDDDGRFEEHTIQFLGGPNHFEIYVDGHLIRQIRRDANPL